MSDTAPISLAGTRALLDVLPVGALLIKHAGLIDHANPRFASMIGEPAEKLADTPVRAWVADSAGDTARADELAAAEEPLEREINLRRADGRNLPTRAAINRLVWTEEGIEYRIVTLVDQSEQREAEQLAQAQLREVSKLGDTVIEQALELKRYSHELEDRVRERTAELHDANMDAILMLAIASEAKDEDTGLHVQRIQSFTEITAKALGIEPLIAEEYGHSSILHDVGKIHVADAILQKPGPLTDEERRIMQQHTLVGERILTSRPFFETARLIARSHHENWDGSGYPDGLAGDQIPVAARIVHVADVFDALTHARAYKPAWPMDQALANLAEHAGSHFDPEIVTTFDQLARDGAFRQLLPT